MAADILRGAVKHGGFTVDLLDGVTGLGARPESISRRSPKRSASAASL
jgi:hypothetical protein